MNRKYFSLFFVVLLVVGCNTRKLQVRGPRPNVDPLAPTDECPQGMTASVALEDSNPANLILNRSIRFRVNASGCQFGYHLYVNGENDTPIPFSGVTGYARVYSTPQTNITDTIQIGVLNSAGEVAHRYDITSAPFSITRGTAPLNCFLDPIVVNVPLPLDDEGHPLLSAPPIVNFVVRSDAPARVTEVRGSDANALMLSNASPIPSTVPATQTTISGLLLIPRTGNFEFTVADAAGNSNKCAADLRVQVGRPSPAQYPEPYFVGDVTGDNVEDVVTVAGDGSVWVATVSPSIGLNYKAFGSFASTGAMVDLLFADFNADGKKDIIGRRVSDNMWRIGFSDGTRFIISDMGTWPSSLILTGVGLADMNADGRPDVVGKINNITYVSNISLGTAPYTATISAPEALPATLNLTAAPLNPAFNGNVDVSWNTDNTVSCTLEKNGVAVSDLPAGPNVSGNYAITGVVANMTLVLKCIQATAAGNGPVRVSNPVNIVVQAPPPGTMALSVKTAASNTAPTANFVAHGAKVFLSWTSEAVTCRLFQGATEADVPATSSFIESIAITQNTLFKLSCNGANIEHTVQLSGSLSFVPNTLIDLGTVNYNAESSERTLTVSATAGRANVSNVRVVMPEGYERSSGTCTTSATQAFNVTQGASCTYKFKFKPKKAAHPSPFTFVGPIRMTYFNGVADVTVDALPLTGQGQDAPAGGK